MLITFKIINRWSREVQFEASIECSSVAPYSIKLGLTVKAAFSVRADLRDADLRDAVLRVADLRDADLLGADLSDADLRGADLSDADLSDAVLRGADLSDADLRDADLRDADLRDADLSGADLRDAVLRGADLRDVPIIPNIDVAILSAIETPGNALDMSDWHRCKTTHCRAGWAITLAGKAGAALEEKYGPATAGALIYAASRPDRPIPNFYANNGDALNDLRACAAQQIAATDGEIAR
jgi:hypothetical protein